jgi:hypothetical protein
MLVKLVATRTVRYGREDHEAGDTFLASERDAKLLLLLKKATLAPQPKRPRHIETQPVVEKKAEPEPQPKKYDIGRYLHRAMQADSGRIGESLYPSSSQVGQVPEPASTDSGLPNRPGIGRGSRSRKT